nr:MAG TPA: hypothetical protein [Caudoviricetes sp.]
MIGTENAESDEAISLLEDMSDTFDDLSSQVSQAGDYKKKYEENDAEWRKRYHDRFFSVTEDDIKEDDKDDEVEKKTFESLFKED